MDTATPRAQSTLAFLKPCKKEHVTPLRTDTLSLNSDLSLVPSGDPTSASTTTSSPSPSPSDTSSFILPAPSRSRTRNMKKLSITLPSAQSSVGSLLSPRTADSPPDQASVPSFAARRRPSVLSLPNASTSSILHRKEEDGDGSPSVPYADGPIQILPGIWLGNEDNARDWRGLVERGIKSVLNVAKEVNTPFDSVNAQPLRSFMSTPDLKTTALESSADSTFYPAHHLSGRPAMHYAKMAWSHGQADLVTGGFPAAMRFVDQALERGDGVLIHCQCGVSRSATLVIALVMRAAAQCSPSVPPEVWALNTMQTAYSFVKEKSKWVGPNMSLIYQLLEYERSFKGGYGSPGASDRSSPTPSDDEWARRRQAVEDADTEDNDRESIEIMREAEALDKAMEVRRIARKGSASSINGSGVGMGQAWRDKYGVGRKRTGSVASTGSFLSEQLVEEAEEETLLGVGGGFADFSCSSAEPTEDECSTAKVATSNDIFDPAYSQYGTPKASRRPSPSAILQRPSAIPAASAPADRTTLEVTPRPLNKGKQRRRPPPLVGLLPPVPSSPITPINVSRPLSSLRAKTERQRPESSIRTRGLSKPFSRKAHRPIPVSATSSSSSSSETLFVFPPSPTLTSHTPSTMTVMLNPSLSFPAVNTPRVATFRSEGRSKSFIGIGAPATPTTASSRVDARGWIGLRKHS